MRRARTRVALAALATGATLALTSVAAAPVTAATVTACVNRTGTFKILLGAKARKACPKGSRKVRWNAPGRTGARGRQGTPGATGGAGPVGRRQVVRDAAGTVLGTLLSVLLEGPAIFIVQREDGGVFYYYGSGQLLPLTSPQFTTADCSGTVYLKPSSSPPFDVAGVLANAGGPARIVYRPTSPGFGPARAWKLTSTAPALVATQLYRLDDTGACVADGPPFSGTVVVLEAVAAPPDGVGPLTIS